MSTYTKVRKGTGFTELSEQVLKEHSLAPLISGAIGRGNVGKGEQLEVFVHGLSTIQNYVAGTGVSLTGDNSDYVTINNLKDKAVNEILDGLTVEQAYNKVDYVSARLEAAMEALADEIDREFFQIIINDVDAAAEVNVDATNVFATILTLKLKLDKAKAPAEGRYLIVSPEAENAILGASNVILNTPTGDTILYDGYLGNFLGFKVLRTTRFPKDKLPGAAGEVKAIGVQMIALQSRALVFADGWKSEPALFDLNDSAHVGDSKIAARLAVNPGVVREDLIQICIAAQ